ncbi:MAG TPA: YtxH domain-containing protein [Candidatus Saccharimonadales bacterium]|nr:YtxH domain-containing protein [Candidatus Saccharimonadales bacterium]
MLHTDDNTNHPHHHNKDVVMAGLAGILAGAASITAIALTDREIRKKVGKKANHLKSSLQDWSVDKLHMVEHHKPKVMDAVERTEKITEEKREDEPLGT